MSLRGFGIRQIYTVYCFDWNCVESYHKCQASSFDPCPPSANHNL